MISLWFHRPALLFFWGQKYEGDSIVCRESVCGSKILFFFPDDGGRDFSETQVLIHQSAKDISEGLKLVLSVKVGFVREVFVFSNVTLRMLVDGYWRFGRFYRSHPQIFPETSVTNHQPTLRNTLEERRNLLHRGGSRKSSTLFYPFVLWERIFW